MILVIFTALILVPGVRKYFYFHLFVRLDVSINIKPVSPQINENDTVEEYYYVIELIKKGSVSKEVDIGKEPIYRYTCMSINKRSVYYMFWQNVGHVFPLYRYDLSTDHVDYIDGGTAILGIFRKGLHKDMLLIAFLDFSDPEGNIQQVKLIDFEEIEYKRCTRQDYGDFIERNRCSINFIRLTLD